MDSPTLNNPLLTPLCVDLDGSLLRSDSLWECLMRLLKTRPWLCLFLFSWMRRGKSTLKSQLAHYAPSAIPHLPWNREVISFIEGEKARGRPIYLITGCSEALAVKLTAHLHLFDQVFGTKDTPQALNLTAQNKADFLLQKFGPGGFDYLGNSRSDLVVWAAARHSIVVNASPTLTAKARATADVLQVITPRSQGKTLRAWVKSLRPHQWAKNVLIFIPIIAAHAIFDSSKLLSASLAFLAFSLCASAIYIINDLLDLDNDRQHPRKQKRAFASGDLSLHAGLLTAPVLIGAACALSLWVTPEFQACLLVYLLLTTLYSWVLKQVVLLDVLTLALLYMMRVIAGGLATGLPLTFWLLAFAGLFFTSLGFVKRYVEVAARKNPEKVPGRAYGQGDRSLIRLVGGSIGLLSCLVFAFYINGSSFHKLYQSPGYLWLGCVLLLYWISRVWVLASRGQVHEDPVVFALKDKTTYGVILLLLILATLAKFY